MPRDLSSTSRAIKATIEGLGYRVSVAVDEDAGQWIATAKDDQTGQFHVVRADSEDAVMAALAESVGIDLEG